MYILDRVNCKVINNLFAYTKTVTIIEEKFREKIIPYGSKYLKNNK